MLDEDSVKSYRKEQKLDWSLMAYASEVAYLQQPPQSLIDRSLSSAQDHDWPAALRASLSKVQQSSVDAVVGAVSARGCAYMISLLSAFFQLFRI